MEKIELRFSPSSISVNDEEMCVEGLVNPTESWSHTLGLRKKFKEKIKKGAFEKAIQNRSNIDFLAEHDSTRILSTTSNRSLQLWEDDEGLKMKATICPTSYGKDMYELMKSSIVSDMSFGFRAISDKWKKLANGTFERIVEELELFEVSVVRTGAYPQTTISARGLDVVEEIDIPEDVEIEERNESMEDDKKVEQRAYASYLYGRNDVINSAMNIVAECSSLSGYLMRYVGEDKDTADVLVSLQHAITMANKIINDEIQVLVDDFKKYDEAIKAEKSTLETNSLKTEEENVEERADATSIEADAIVAGTIDADKIVTGTLIADSKITNAKIEDAGIVTDKLAEGIVEKVEETDKRSYDLESYRKRVKERRQIDEN